MDSNDASGTPVAARIERLLPDSIPSATEVSVVPGELTKLDVISEGECATRYAARHTAAGAEVVLQLMTLSLPDSVAVDRIVEAIERWDTVSSHDFVLSVLDWGSDPDPWLALEYVDGGTIRDRDDLAGGERLWIALGVLRALSYAHSRGVFHLGLRPDGVYCLQALDGVWSVPKVGGWDLARLIERIEGGPDPRYAAPEQLDPGAYGDPDQCTDVYRAGAVLYELFAGRPPHRDETSVLDGTPPDPGEVADIPSGLGEVLSRAVRRDPTVRYETVDDFRRGLEGFVRDYAGEAVLTSFLERGQETASTGRGPELTRREQAVLEMVDRVDDPVTPRGFANRIASRHLGAEEAFEGLRHRTVATNVLNRLVEKGALTRFKEDRWYYDLPDGE